MPFVGQAVIAATACVDALTNRFGRTGQPARFSVRQMGLSNSLVREVCGRYSEACCTRPEVCGVSITTRPPMLQVQPNSTQLLNFCRSNCRKQRLTRMEGNGGNEVGGGSL